MLKSQRGWHRLVGHFRVGCLATACTQSPPPQSLQSKPPSRASEAWNKVSNAFIEDYLRAQPFFAAQSGRHEFDGQLPDVSDHGIKREIARLHDQRQNRSLRWSPRRSRRGSVSTGSICWRSSTRILYLDGNRAAAVQEPGLVQRQG